MAAHDAPPGHRALRIGRVSLIDHVYHVTTSTLHRQALFADSRAAAAAARALTYRPLLGESELLAWVLMPDHLHMLLRLGGGDTLDGLVGRVKAATARCVNREIGRTGPVWQRAYHDHGLRREEDLVTTARYIVANPLRAGLVRRIGDYPYWNAVWL